MTNTVERYPIIKSIEDSLKEVKMIRSGKMKPKKIEDCFAEWEKWAIETELEIAQK